jgi:hypothetical protein
MAFYESDLPIFLAKMPCHLATCDTTADYDGVFGLPVECGVFKPRFYLSVFGQNDGLKITENRSYRHSRMLLSGILYYEAEIPDKSTRE